jgi:hypothetical protein
VVLAQSCTGGGQNAKRARDRDGRRKTCRKEREKIKDCMEAGSAAEVASAEVVEVAVAREVVVAEEVVEEVKNIRKKGT